MSYGQRVVAILCVFFGLVIAMSVYVVMASREFASDDLHVGKGSVKFPPQTHDGPKGGR